MPANTFRKRVLRRDDLLALEFEFVNLRLSDDATTVNRADPAADAFIVVHFPPQHVAEQAFVQDENNALPVGPVPVLAALAGTSRLAFALPEGVDELPFRLEDLLDWNKLALSVPANALPPKTTDGPPLAPLEPTQTAVEFPYRLMLSPDATETWLNALSPITRAGLTELWHTRLARRTADGPHEEGATVRAVGYRNTRDPFLILLPKNTLVDGLLVNQFDQIVTLTSNFSIRPRPRVGPFAALVFRIALVRAGILADYHYVPRPIEAERLMLTSLGAYARLSSAWDYPTALKGHLDAMNMPATDLQQWQHVTTLGRDQYVRTVSKGFACPTGHRLSIDQVVERQFHPRVARTVPGPNGNVALFGEIAYLRYYKRIIVQQPEMEYTQPVFLSAYKNDGREMPLRKIRLTTLVTPKLDPSTSETLPSWIRSGEQDVQFGVVAEDWAGHQVTFSMPLMFVPYLASKGVAPIGDIQTEFNKIPSRKIIHLQNQVVAFAPSDGDSTATHLRVAQMTIDIQTSANGLGTLPGHYPLQYLPTAELATVQIPAVSELLGREEAVPIRLHKAFLDHGMVGENAVAEAFIELINPVKLNFAAEKSGGLAKPDMGINGLTRKMGAVASVKEVIKGNVDTSAFENAELLGGIKIKDILTGAGFDPNEFGAVSIPPAALEDPNVKVRVPMLTTRRTATAVETRYLWKPDIKSFSILLTGAGENGFDRPAQLILSALLTRPLDGGEGTFRIDGRLLNFALGFAGVLRASIGRLSFLSEAGRKPDVSAEEVTLTFEGALAFVNTLKDILPSNGFSDPPYVNVDTAGIVAGYTLGVPSVGVGIFSIQNIALGAALSVPFVSKPAGVRFNISERHQPFIVTVGIFGGGGFFALAVSANGLEQVEAAIEFGGNISLNLGVASGGVYVMAGIYFNMTPKSVQLTGYLRCGGYLEVLGIISISIEFYLAFTYLDKGGGRGEAWGQASVTVSVKVAFFSTSVSLSIERRFAGAAGDPTVVDMVDLVDWEEYCSAFV